MNLCKKVIFSILAIVAIASCVTDLTFEAYSFSDGPPIASGAPGEANCTFCHTATPQTSLGIITSNVPVTGYIPGAIYTITATISVTGINKFGFEVSTRNSTGSQNGTIIVTDTSQTILVGFSPQHISHKLLGTAGAGSKTWTFNWIAPIAGSGNVTLYGAFVAANSSGTNDGDQVFLSSLLIQENLSASIAEPYTNSNSWMVFPNPASEKVTVTTLDLNNKIESIEIIDITGKLIKVISFETFAQSQSIDISDLQSGVYVLNMQTGKNIITKKFVKQ